MHTQDRTVALNVGNSIFQGDFERFSSNLKGSRNFVRDGHIVKRFTFCYNNTLCKCQTLNTDSSINYFGFVRHVEIKMIYIHTNFNESNRLLLWPIV